MTDADGPDPIAGPDANRRDVLKGLLFGGTLGADSRRDAVRSLILGGAVGKGPPDRPQEDDEIGLDYDQLHSSPIPVRATKSVSIRDIADNTNGVSGPPYKLTEVAEERGLLNATSRRIERTSLPFALRELITSQEIANKTKINNTAGSRGSSWKNWVGDHFSRNLTKFEPDTKRELVDAVLWNAREGNQIRAVGSGHSHSEVASPDKAYIKLSREDSANSLEGLVEKKSKDWIVGGYPNHLQQDEGRVRVEAGATIKYLNRKLLLDDDYGLPNMGSFDAQTLAGAVNTSTHGTGARLGSLADAVESVELVTVMQSPAQPTKPLVRTYRIEPNDGITDRDKFEAATGDHQMTLIQNDDVFHSVVVGYGCMGVAYSYTIKVRDKYFLYEDNETVKWNDFKNDISDLIGRPDKSKHFKSVDGARHFQFRVNLAQLDTRGNDKGDRNPRCLLVSHREPHEYFGTVVSYDRWPSKPNNWSASWLPERKQRSTQKKIRNMMNNLKGGTGLPPKNILWFVPVGINSRFQSSQNNAPFEADVGNFSRESDPGGYMTASHIALRRLREDDPRPAVAPEPPPPAISTEIAVPADQVVTAVEGIFEEVISNEYAFSAPLGVRFVARSDHALSPEYRGENDRDVPVAKVEVPFPVGRFKVSGLLVNNRHIKPREMLAHGHNALGDIEDRLLDMADQGKLDFARPHMGKTNTVSNQQLADFYDDFDTWEAIHAEFNAFGTFNNGFTRNKGISK